MGLLDDLTSPLKKRYAVPNDNVTKLVQPGYLVSSLIAVPEVKLLQRLSFCGWYCVPVGYSLLFAVGALAAA